MKVSKLRNLSIAIASLVASSTAFAAMDMDSRVSQLENQMQQVRTETAMGTYGAQTATARAEVDGYGWFINFDVLYWRARVGGTEFAYTDQDPVGSLPVRGQAKEVRFGWDWGIRVGLGYNFDYDGWDAKLLYTWFDSSSSNSTSAGQGSSVIPLRGSSDILPGSRDFTYCNRAKSRNNFDLDALALELGRAYFVSGKLSFRPHWGLKTAWIDQTQTVRYSGGSVVSNGSTGLGNDTVTVEDRCDFWGLGPRVGLDSNWHLGAGFSIFGNVAGALLYGQFDITHTDRLSIDKDNSISLNANRHAFSPTAQMHLGIKYDKYLNNNKQHIGVGLGFEAQYWWRQNQSLKIDDSSPLKYERFSEDVALYGVTLDFQWDF